jgi:glycine/D-amino acid oxidase-like deaminating enzyme
MDANVVVIGGGYYGCATATEIRAVRPDLKVVVVEQADSPFARASTTNQGQLHAGYMYSNFPELARECASGAKDFASTYSEAIIQDTLTYYGVHQDSKIKPNDYEAFCTDVGLPLEVAPDPPKGFRGIALAKLYKTTEKTFDNSKLQRIMRHRLAANGATLITGFSAAKVVQTPKGLEVVSADGRSIRARTVFNATFADSNKLHDQSGIAKLPLEHAVFLHFLVRLPKEYDRRGLIVVSGAYAALAPAATNSSHVSHVFASGKFRVVRTGHLDAPSEVVSEADIAHRYEQAVTEASTYMPAIQSAKRVGHTIGTRTNYIDPVTGVANSRAVVLKNYDGIKNYHCIFGGKVTCLSEIIEPVREIAQST